MSDEKDPLPPLFQFASKEEQYGRLAAGAVLTVLVIWSIFEIPGPEGGFAGLFTSLIPMANLAFHELGHLILGAFGLPKFLVVLGGTLGQLAVPLSVMGKAALLRNAGFFWAGFVWVGHNLTNISVYMRDANARQLPLFRPDGLANALAEAMNPETAREVGHDWNYLFSSTGLLPAADAIGWLTLALGTAVMIFGCFGLIAAPEARILARKRRRIR